MAETAALSPQYLKQLRAEREARLAAKKGASAPAPAPSASSPDADCRGVTIGIDDDLHLDEAAIKRMKCVELRAACTERNQLASGNKAHLQHRLLRLCGHVAWARHVVR